MSKTGKSTSDEPDWIDPANPRKKPYSGEELDMFVDDFIANLSDVQAWKDRVDNVGEGQARQTLKERFMAQDGNNLVNWNSDGLLN